MRRIALTFGVAWLLAGCVGTAVNQATIYTPVTGVIEMDVKVPAGQSVSKVQFQVNDKVVGEDDGSSGTGIYSAEVDTTGLPVDTLAKLAAVGVGADGSQTVLKENYILVEASTDTSATSAATTPGTDDAGTPTTTAYKGDVPVPSAVAAPKAAAKPAAQVVSKARKVTIIHL